MLPDAALAATLAAQATGQKPDAVRRFTTGSMHYVFEASFADRPPIVVRIAAPYGHDAMRGASQLSHRLRPLGVPLPVLLAEDINAPAPWLVLERLPGTDLGDVIGTLPDAALNGIAGEVARAQRIVATTRSSGHYGYAVDPEDAPHQRWSDVLRAHLDRSRTRLAAANLFDNKTVAVAAAMIERFAAELDAQPATPFLHDTTTKNVIVTADGKFSGIVDVDDLCFGDPRYVVALTLTALLAHRHATHYVEAWMRLAGFADDHIFRLYVLLFIADFMSEHGQVFNGNQGPSRAEDRAHLTALFDDNLDMIARPGSRGGVAMRLIIIGSEGNVGRRLMAAFPGAVGIDRVAGAGIVADLATIDYDAPAVRAAFETADGVVHVGTEANPQAPDEVHYAAVTGAARLLEACLRYRVPRLVLPSSGWADPKPEFGGINAYGHSKRVFEAMAAMYANTGARAVALRIGWVALTQEDVDAAYPALRADYWDTETLVSRVKAALGV